jgi:putative ABC transport system permease protein
MIPQLRLAIRRLRKYPVFSIINLGGLAIGIAASFILLIYAQRELSTDRHFRNADRIVRLGTDFYQIGPFAFTQPMLRDLALTTCKDVEDATGIHVEYDSPVRTSFQDRAFTDIRPYSIDSSFFHVFSYEAASGFIPQKGLAPAETILSESIAKRLFGRQDAIGQTLYIGKDRQPYKVIAVLRETFAKSHLEPQLLLPRKPDPNAAAAGWTNISQYNYVLLRPQGSIAGLRSWLEQLREKVIYPASGSAQPYAKWKNEGTSVSFAVQPLTDIYFSSDLKFDLSPGGNLMQVRLLAAIGILLIALAIINYVNLVTARSSVRAKEIALKKTFGALRPTLITQIVNESILFSGFAMLLACGLIQVILFIYQYSTGSALTGPIPFLSANYLWLVLFSLAVGLLAGFYPAIYLTGFRPGLIVRSTSASGKDRPRLRNALVTIQFAIAIGLVFVSFVVYSQLQYIKSRDMGLRKEGVLIVQNAGDMQQHVDAFRQLVEQQAQVTGTSFCERTPGDRSEEKGTYRTGAMKQNMLIETFTVDDQYLSTMGIRLTAGRNFNKDLLSDTNSLILNESAVAALGLFQPVGSRVNSAEVIGVVKDFNYASLHEKIGPAILQYRPKGNTLAIRLKGGQPSAFLEWLRQTGRKFLPDEPLNISFLDENFGRLAEKERLLGKAITFFTVLAILLATLGLIGLTLFTIERRTKEIGIRKVLGADRISIIRLIARDFARLAVIASALAFPAGWWLIGRWLDNFAYRVSIGIGTFFITEALILLIAFAVIGGLTLKALAADPVKNLRTE